MALKATSLLEVTLIGSVRMNWLNAVLLSQGILATIYIYIYIYTHIYIYTEPLFAVCRSAT